MRHHRLDLIPLLDIMMVVLFVFATIKEAEVDEISEASAQELSDAERSREDAVEQREKSDADLVEAKKTIEKLKRDKAISEARAAAATDSDADEAQRRQSVIAELLRETTVVELEIKGAFAEGGAVENQCCFRRGVDGPFLSCGTVPADVEDRETWRVRLLDTAAFADLNKKQEGDVLVLVRQDAVATFEIGARVAKELGDATPGQRVVVEGVRPLSRTCQADR